MWYAMTPVEDEYRNTSPLVLESIVLGKWRSWQPTCLNLHSDTRNVSMARAERLMREFELSPARLPPSEWRPKVAGLIEPKPLPPVPEECLESDYVPLNAPDNWPRKKLPKHCDAYR
jgi:hypothetical protein